MRVGQSLGTVPVYPSSRFFKVFEANIQSRAVLVGRANRLQTVTPIGRLKARAHPIGQIFGRLGGGQCAVFLGGGEFAQDGINETAKRLLLPPRRSDGFVNRRMRRHIHIKKLRRTGNQKRMRDMRAQGQSTFHMRRQMQFDLAIMAQACLYNRIGQIALLRVQRVQAVAHLIQRFAARHLRQHACGDAAGRIFTPTGAAPFG